MFLHWGFYFLQLSIFSESSLSFIFSGRSVFTGMTQATEILQNIKKLVFGDEQAPVQLKEYALDNGTKVMISDMVVGGMVTLEDGSPAPVGEHTLADGAVLVLSEGGVIAEVKLPEVEEPESEMGKDKDKEMYSKFEEMSQNFSGLSQKFEAVTGELNTLKAAFAKQEELNQKFISILDTLIQEPSTTPTEPVKSGFGSHKETKEEKLKRLFNANPYKK